MIAAIPPMGSPMLMSRCSKTIGATFRRMSARWWSAKRRCRGSRGWTGAGRFPETAGYGDAWLNFAVDGERGHPRSAATPLDATLANSGDLLISVLIQY